MFKHVTGFPAAIALTVLASAFFSPAHAQGPGGGGSEMQVRVSGPSQKLEMIVGTSRILTLDFKVPDLLVNNENVLTATPLAPDQVQVFARTPGVTQLVLWDENKKVHSIDVFVHGDSRELQNLLNSVFPDSDIQVRPSNGAARGSVILSGFVPRAEQVSRIQQIASDFYPNVINNMSVGGVQTVLLHVKVFEVSRTKLRRLGVDWQALLGNDFIVSGVSGLISAAASAGGTLTGTGTVRFGVMDGGNNFGALIDVLRQHNMAKLLAEPTLVTVSGRPASFNSGGEVPVPVSAGLGVTTVEYREFGTQVDFVPIVLGNGNIRLEVRPQITEIAADLRDPVTQTPGFRSRRVDTGVEMKAGQTLALAGLIQSRVEASNQGLPVLGDLPWVGAAFRRVQEQVNEIELLIMVTPEFVSPMQPHEVPAGPGTFTQSPTDVELYGRGYLETPRLNGDQGYPYSQPIPPAGSHGSGFDGGVDAGTRIETLPPVIPADQANGLRQRGAIAGQQANPNHQGRPASYQSQPHGGIRRPAGQENGIRRPAGQENGIRRPAGPYAPRGTYGAVAPPRVHVDTTPQLIGPSGYDDLK